MSFSAVSLGEYVGSGEDVSVNTVLILRSWLAILREYLSSGEDVSVNTYFSHSEELTDNIG